MHNLPLGPPAPPQTETLHNRARQKAQHQNQTQRHGGRQPGAPTTASAKDARDRGPENDENELPAKGADDEEPTRRGAEGVVAEGGGGEDGENGDDDGEDLWVR